VGVAGVTTWTIAALIIAAASFVQGLAGFGIGIVSLAFLPFLVDPAVAVVLVTVYAAAFAFIIFVQLRGDVRPRSIADLLLGTLLGTMPGVWILASLPASVLTRVIGLVLVVIVVLELRGLYPERLRGRHWGLGAGLIAGVLGGAVGTPGPPVILYATTQGWSPRTIKANLQLFFVVNQLVILGGYWWAGLLTREVGRLALLFAVPAVVGLVAGMGLFARIDAVKFRRTVFAVIFFAGAVLLIRG
jgi:uncharacterized membrane protein YfcA